MKIDSIQALRGLGFIFIFLHHCSITPLFAGMAVSMFLLLSGFLLASKHYSNDEMCQWGIADSFLYAKKKIEKLYPLHIITMVLAIGIYIIYRKPWEEIVTNIILNVLLVQAWIPKQMYYFSLNGVSWYLSVCVFCYFIFPFVLKVMKKSGGIKWLMAMAITIFISQALIRLLLKNNLPTEIITGVTYTLPLFRAGDFIIGCIIGYLYAACEKEWLRCTATLLCIFIVINTCLGGSYLPSALALLVVFLLNRTLISNNLFGRILIFMGDISACAFLTHQIIIKYIKNIGNDIGIIENKWIVALVAFVFTLFVSKMYLKCMNAKQR